MRGTLLLSAALGLALALLYVYVGRVVRARHIDDPHSARARDAFSFWWFGFAAFTLTGAAQHALGGIDILDRGIFAALTYLSIGPLVAALWGLLYYLVYIYVGHGRYYTPILVAHVAIAIFLFVLIARMHALSVTATDWDTDVIYEHPLEGALRAFVLALLLVPILIAAVAYLSLAFRTHDLRTRFRIFTVSGAFIAWLGSLGLASAVGWNDWYWWPLASRAIALAATILILAAFRPPRALQTSLDALEARRAAR